MPKQLKNTDSAVREYANNDTASFFILRSACKRLIPGLTAKIRKALRKRDEAALRSAMLHFANFGS